jgi:NAD(P)H dehydrogenase (quinone)
LAPQAVYHQSLSLLLISSSGVLGQRAAHHKNVIDAATRAKVSLIAYTSILRADVGAELRCRTSGNREDFARERTAVRHIAQWHVPHGAIIGSAGGGRLSSASRSNYAEAAALVLLQGAPAGTVYELAGDKAFTLTQLATAVS